MTKYANFGWTGAALGMLTFYHHICALVLLAEFHRFWQHDCNSMNYLVQLKLLYILNLRRLPAAYFSSTLASRGRHSACSQTDKAPPSKHQPFLSVHGSMRYHSHQMVEP